MQTQLHNQWTTICKKEDLTANAGICAQFNDEQVAIFFDKRNNALYALANFDPFGQANVISRGIIGSTEDIVYVASPLYKQRFNLQTGECLESPVHALKIYPIRFENDEVQLKRAS
ncbi:nitrite reductase small subunit NirD [Psychromonas sp. MME2]|uniref:nitrite reductase small subunit NirD n=1 Tax=unclassified Psychromonas TaxID=2614957 RepID=UPI00339C4667